MSKCKIKNFFSDIGIFFKFALSLSVRNSVTGLLFQV